MLLATVVGLVVLSAREAVAQACDTPELWFLNCVCGGVQPCPVASKNLEDSSKETLDQKKKELAAAQEDLTTTEEIAQTIGSDGARPDPLASLAYNQSVFIAAVSNSLFFAKNPPLQAASVAMADAMDGAASSTSRVAAAERYFSPVLSKSGRPALSAVAQEVAVDAISISARASIDWPAIEHDTAALEAAIGTAADFRADIQVNSKARILLAELVERRSALAAIDAQLVSLSDAQPK